MPPVTLQTGSQVDDLPDIEHLRRIQIMANSIWYRHFKRFTNVLARFGGRLSKDRDLAYKCTQWMNRGNIRCERTINSQVYRKKGSWRWNVLSLCCTMRSQPRGKVELDACEQILAVENACMGIKIGKTDPRAKRFTRLYQITSQRACATTKVKVPTTHNYLTR